jgi:hypothetical protein
MLHLEGAPFAASVLAGFAETVMAKFKAAGTRKSGVKKSNRSAIPCLLVIVIVFALVALLFYGVLKSGS